MNRIGELKEEESRTLSSVFVPCIKDDEVVSLSDCVLLDPNPKNASLLNLTASVIPPHLDFAGRETSLYIIDVKHMLAKIQPEKDK